MYVDYKKTIWERIYINDSTMTADQRNDVVKAIADNPHANSFLWDVDPDNEPEREDLYETECILSPEDNGGHTTIEVYNSNDELIWKNGIE